MLVLLSLSDGMQCVINWWDVVLCAINRVAYLIIEGEEV